MKVYGMMTEYECSSLLNHKCECYSCHEQIFSTTYIFMYAHTCLHTHKSVQEHSTKKRIFIQRFIAASPSTPSVSVMALLWEKYLPSHWLLGNCWWCNIAMQHKRCLHNWIIKNHKQHNFSHILPKALQADSNILSNNEVNSLDAEN